MKEIKTSNIIYFFIILFPLSQFLLPFLIFGNEISIRIYEEGSFYNEPTSPEYNIIFKDNGAYSLEVPQGSIYAIDHKSIYISLLYFLIFFFTGLFTFGIKNKNLSYDIDFFKQKKSYIFKYFFFFFVLIFVINYFELTIISNFFYNLLIILKIFLIFSNGLLIFKSKNKKNFIFYIFLMFIVILYVSE